MFIRSWDLRRIFRTIFSLRFLSFFLVFTLIILSAFENYLVIAASNFPVGSDINLHLRLVQGWLDLDYPIFNEAYFNNGYPYPPAFHLTIAVLSVILFTNALSLSLFLQVVMYPAIILSTFFFLYRKTDIHVSALGVILLASSPAFWDRGMQVIPQALDVLIFPLILYAFMERRENSFVIGSVYLIYNHWFYAFLLVFSVFLYSVFYERDRLKGFLKIAVFCVPLAIVMFYHAPAMLAESGGINEPQELGVLTEPLFAVKYLGYPLFFLIFITAIHLKFKKTSKVERLAIFWIVGILPMAVFFPDRFIEYAAQPLAILGGIAVFDIIKSEKLKFIVLFLAFLFSAVSIFYFYEALLAVGGVWMPLDTLSPFVGVE